jgi:tetratricopeptide (TPR) repeat protein
VDVPQTRPPLCALILVILTLAAASSLSPRSATSCLASPPINRPAAASFTQQGLAERWCRPLRRCHRRFPRRPHLRSHQLPIPAQPGPRPARQQRPPPPRRSRILPHCSLAANAPQDAAVNLALARVAARRGSIEEATLYYHNAMYGVWNSDADANRNKARIELVQFLLKRRAPHKAESELMALATSLPPDPAAHLQAAQLFEQAQDYANALAQYEEVLRLDPANSVCPGRRRPGCIPFRQLCHRPTLSRRLPSMPIRRMPTLANFSRRPTSSSALILSTATSPTPNATAASPPPSTRPKNALPNAPSKQVSTLRSLVHHRVSAFQLAVPLDGRQTRSSPPSLSRRNRSAGLHHGRRFPNRTADREPFVVRRKASTSPYT